MIQTYQATFEADVIEKVEWDFPSISHWKREFDEVKLLKIQGSTNRDNLIRFAIFFVKTLDHITDTKHLKGH